MTDRLNTLVGCLNNFICKLSKKRTLQNFNIRVHSSANDLFVHACNPSDCKYVWQACASFEKQMLHSKLNEVWNFVHKPAKSSYSDTSVPGNVNEVVSKDIYDKCVVLYNITMDDIENIIIPKLDSMPKDIKLEKISYLKHRQTDTYAIAVHCNLPHTLLKLLQPLHTCKLLTASSSIQLIDFNTFCIDYEPLAINYQNKANIVGIKSFEKASKLIEQLKLQSDTHIIKAIVCEHVTNNRFFVHLTFDSTKNKDNFVYQWIKQSNPLQQHFCYRIYSHSNNYNKEIFFQHQARATLLAGGFSSDNINSILEDKKFAHIKLLLKQVINKYLVTITPIKSQSAHNTHKCRFRTS